MGYEQKRGYGTLFNNRKGAESHPDVKGSIKLDRDYQAGDTLEFAGWKRQDKNGNDYFSLAEDKPYNPDDKEKDVPF